MVVTVFSEHPSLLSAAERAAWAAVAQASLDALGERLALALPADATPVPALRLHGYARPPWDDRMGAWGWAAPCAMVEARRPRAAGAQ